MVLLLLVRVQLFTQSLSLQKSSAKSCGKVLTPSLLRNIFFIFFLVLSIFYFLVIFTFITFYTFSIFLLLSSAMLILSKNPVHSIFFLILCFFNTSCLLFLLELEYLPLIFIIIYVGAIAVLFIFVIMLLNIRLSYLRETNSHFLALGFLFLIFFVLQTLFTLRLDISNFSNINFLFISEITLFVQELFNAVNWFYTETNMKGVGFLIFYEYFFIFVLLGFILLLALMGVIILVSQKRFRSKSQIISKQVLKDFEKALKKV